MAVILSTSLELYFFKVLSGKGTELILSGTNSPPADDTLGN
jgi:hypothetical protein